MIVVLLSSFVGALIFFAGIVVGYAFGVRAAPGPVE